MAQSRLAGFAAASRPLRSKIRRLSDEELLEKLRFHGIGLDRTGLENLFESTLSAQDATESLLDHRPPGKGRGRFDSDWIWGCFAVLWERWRPLIPSFEGLDDKIEAGHEASKADNTPEACRLWLDAWKDTVALFRKSRLEDLESLDQRFRGSESLIEWVQDFSAELNDAGSGDPHYWTIRAEVIEEALRVFSGPEEALTEFWRRDLGETYFQLGQTARADGMFLGWLKDDPEWGWGWISWADCYHDAGLPRCEDILRDALRVEEVRDRSDILHRLADVYTDQGRDEEAAALREEAESGFGSFDDGFDEAQGFDRSGNVLRQVTKLNFAGAGIPLDDFSSLAKMLARNETPPSHRVEKAGRNEPCPCGSGKKYKKCHGG